MKQYIIAIRRFLFGWKTSDLIERIIKDGVYHPSGVNAEQYMCIAFFKFLGYYRYRQINYHRNKIRDLIYPNHTLLGYLFNTLQEDRLPTNEEMFQFWSGYIQELRAKGE